MDCVAPVTNQGFATHLCRVQSVSWQQNRERSSMTCPPWQQRYAMAETAQILQNNRLVVQYQKDTRRLWGFRKGLPDLQKVCHHEVKGPAAAPAASTSLSIWKSGWTKCRTIPTPVPATTGCDAKSALVCFCLARPVLATASKGALMTPLRFQMHSAGKRSERFARKMR